MTVTAVDTLPLAIAVFPTREFADLRPGDQIHAEITTAGAVIHDPPLLVTHAAAPIGDLGTDNVIGVRVHNRHLDHVLYQSRTLAAKVTRQRGYGSIEGATRAAVKAAGWTTRGGCYYRPIPGTVAEWGYQGWEYSGVRGVDQMEIRVRRWGWVVAIGDRWYYTGQASRWARDWAAEDAAIAAAASSS